MLTGRTVADLSAEVERQADAKADYLAPAGEFKVYTNGATKIDFGAGPYEVGDVAHGQVAEYLGIPKGFYDRLRVDEELTMDGDQPLYDVVVNRLLQSKGPENRLVRTLDGRARAVLSDSFNPDLDNYDVLRIAAKAIQQSGLSHEAVVSSEVTDKRMYLKVLSPSLEADVVPGSGVRGWRSIPQAVRGGFILSNSEVGLGSLSVQAFAMVLVCTNGMIRDEVYRQRHLGRSLESDGDGGIYWSDTRVADAQARLLKVRDHISEALKPERFNEFVERMQESTSVKLGKDPNGSVEATARRFGLSKAEKDQVFRNLIEGADLSLWGLSNAVTLAAGQIADYDRSTDLEVVGGRIVTLSAADIKDIVLN